MIGVITGILSPSAPQTSTGNTSTGSNTGTATQTAVAVEPSTQSGATDNSGSDSGSSSEQQSQQQQAAVYASTPGTVSLKVPSRAQPQSIFDAVKLRADPVASEDDLARARQNALDHQRELRTQFLIEGFVSKDDDETMSPSAERDPYALPDPIPLSDILKRMKEIAPKTVAAE